MTHEIYSKEYFDVVFKEGSERVKQYGLDEFEYLSKVIGLMTYDVELDCLFAFDVVMAIDAIIEDKQLELIEDKQRYKDYIMAINLPFLSAALEWGTSIRYCWFYAANGNFAASDIYRAFEVLDDDNIHGVIEIKDTDSLINFFTAFRDFFLNVINTYEDYGFVREEALEKWNKRYDSKNA